MYIVVDRNFGLVSAHYNAYFKNFTERRCRSFYSDFIAIYGIIDFPVIGIICLGTFLGSAPKPVYAVYPPVSVIGNAFGEFTVYVLKKDVLPAFKRKVNNSRTLIHHYSNGDKTVIRKQTFSEILVGFFFNTNTHANQRFDNIFAKPTLRILHGGVIFSYIIIKAHEID